MTNVTFASRLAISLFAIALAAGTRAPITAAISARAIQPGELVVLTLTTEGNADRVRVRGFDRDLTPWRVDAHTWRVLVGIDLDVPPGRAIVTTTATIGGHA